MSIHVIIGLIGIIVSLSFMTFAVYKNWNVIYTSVACVVILTITSQLNLVEVFTKTFANGVGNFVAPNLLIFVEGAILGKLFSESGAAWRIGDTVVKKMGVKWSLLGYIIVTSFLTWGGISAFVIYFILLPLSRPIFKKTGTPWYLWPGLTLMGIVPPELIWPGGLQIHNILPTHVLGTNLMAAPVMSIVMAVVFYLFCAGYLYLEYRSIKKTPWKQNSLPPEVDDTDDTAIAERAPGLIISLIPILVCLGSINILKLEPIFGLGLGVIAAIILFYKATPNLLECMNIGTETGVKPLVCVACIVGIAQVVASTDAFGLVKDLLLSFSSTSKVVTAVSVVFSTNIVALICGSASGAITMILEMFSDTWLAAGLSPEWIHRTVCAAAGGFDTVPWNTGVIVALTVSGLNHKKAYKPVFWLSLVAPIVAAMACVFFV
ncbi:MAG: hypothetical protein PHC41_10440 [Lachnospiraceae bacterium]|jgi:H+/gluconate symporter-like permease|nr:hypothetical protein [Lachnospiraceae bacterium]MDD3616626.1 hypothetical protein [Lachnospiraceae bacterium]